MVAVMYGRRRLNATITSDNTQAGEMACKYITDRLKGKGNAGDYQRAAGFRRAEPR